MPLIRYSTTLPLQLQKKTFPFFLLYGNDTFLIEDSARMIREQLLSQGHIEVLTMTLDSAVSWEPFMHQLQNQSLFSETLLLDVKITGKFSTQEHEKILAILQQPIPGITVLFKTDQLSKPQSQKWFSAFEKQGLMISHYPLVGAQFNQWVLERARQAGLALSKEAITLLNYHTESNCLAAAQEIERLSLYYAGNMQTPITISHLDEQSQFEVFDLCEAALSANAARVIKIISSLKSAQDAPLSLVIWALAQMLRALLASSALPSTEQQRQRLLQSGIRSTQQPLYLKALTEHKPAIFAMLLAQLSAADTTFKAGNVSSAWRQIVTLCLVLAKCKTTECIL